MKLPSLRTLLCNVPSEGATTRLFAALLLLAGFAVTAPTGQAAGILTVQVGSPAPPPTVLVDHFDTWRWHKGTNAPTVGWQTTADASLDATWGTGAGGFGYADNVNETSQVGTVLSDMLNRYTTFYMRKAFTASGSIDPNAHLQFTIDYDDAFVAYLDGVEVARSVNAPGAVGTEPTSIAVATSTHESSRGNSAPANPPAVYDLGAVGNRLSAGTHVLAILGLNQSLGSSDLIMIADLAVTGGSSVSTVSGGFLSIVYSNSVVLSGSNTVVGSSRVSVNGDDAAFDAIAHTWSKTNSLLPGVNRFFFAALDASGNLLGATNQLIVSEVSSTSVGGTLAGNTSWSPAMGNIHVSSNVIIPAGATLAIEPGTVLLVTPGANLRGTNAILNATGTLSAPIYFLPADGSSPNWGEFAISGISGTMLVQHVETIGGHIELLDGAIGTLEDSYFHDYTNSSPAIIHTLGNPNHVTLNLRRCHIAHYYEILCQLSVNHIEDCLGEYLAYSGDAIDFDAGQPGSYIRRCTLRRGTIFNTDALDMGESGAEGSHGVVIDSCLLHDFIDKGVSMGVGVEITVTNTLIYNVDSGIAVKDNSIAGVFNTTIANANFGFHEYNKADPNALTGGGHITNSFNNILWNVGLTISLANGSTLEASYTDFQATNWPGTGNFSTDPLFVNPAINDYRVAGNSPTIGAGLNGANLGVTLPVGGIPGAPLNLAAVVSGTNAAQLVWVDDADNEDGFAIERSTDLVNWSGIGSAAANVTQFLDLTAAANVKFYYRVRAINSTGVSAYSNPASATRRATLVIAGGNVGGAVTEDTCWADNGIFTVTSSVTVNSGVTLTIKPGASVQFNAGASLTVANGGTLLALGTSNAPIQFTRSGASSWGGVTVNGAVGSPETHIEWANFLGNSQNPCIQVSAGTVFFDHLSFSNTAASYIHVDSSSFIIQNCVFPSATAQFELCHGTGGIKSGGHGIFQRNFFGLPIGYNDVVDFTGGNRPGPIVHFIDNVCIGASDDVFDLDGTDAWVEHNIFLHVHKNGSPDTASCISGSDDSGSTSQITIVGNLMFDCDAFVMGKGGNFYTLFNNTIVHQNHTAGLDTDGAVLILADEGFGEAAGMYVEGNIIYDAEKLMRFHTNSIVTFTNNIISTNATWTTNLVWTGPGGNNSTNDPLLKVIPTLAQTANFTSWADAQVLWDWFSLKTNSPAIGTGPNARDKGGVVPIGASISGEPSATTTQTVATLVVGINRTGNGIPSSAAAWPNGSGYTTYRWRLDTNAWSAERPIVTPIALTGLANGPHYVEVSGKRDSGLFQDDLFFGPEAVLTRSRTWTVGPILRISRISATGPNSIELEFTAEANTGYTIEYRDDLSAGTWLPLSPHIDPINSQHLVTFPDTIPVGTPTRFYRLLAQ